MKKICEHCGKEFYKDAYSNLGKNWDKRKYCSLKCVGLANHPRINTAEHMREYWKQICIKRKL